MRPAPADIEQIIAATSNKKELIKLISHYQQPNDSLKLKAAYFLIRNMDDQFHLAGESVQESRRIFNQMDSLNKLGKGSARKIWDSLTASLGQRVTTTPDTIKDIDIITCELLVDNIDNAFNAWNYPWARRLNFDDFCKYILPYKLKNESPESWRVNMMQRYAWVLKTVKDSGSLIEAASLINNDIRKWFYITPKFNCVGDPNCGELLKLKAGQCIQAAQLAAYAMRAMGIPVTLDYTPFWANKSGRHDWNSLISPLGDITFMGGESDPGFEKVEDPGYNYLGATQMKRKRAKIYRYSFEKVTDTINARQVADVPVFFQDHHHEDVTDRVIPVSTITLTLDTILPQQGLAYLCVFNNKQWEPVQWGKTGADKKVSFATLGRDVVYLPMIYRNNEYWPAADPLILHRNGTVRTLHANLQQCREIIIVKKYPEDQSNNIIPGYNYELYYWNKEWISLGKQMATKDYLVFDHVPENALLFIRNLDAGFQERIFTFENKQQIWW
ncbi:transglutaminase-like domain-containing protein [Niastella vici]|nr:transglutaminase-like domain-containing protein [Niastella vici]